MHYRERFLVKIIKGWFGEVKDFALPAALAGITSFAILLYMDNGKVLALSQKRVAGFKEKMNEFIHEHKYAYPAVKLALSFLIAAVNMLDRALLNFVTWIVIVALVACFLYYEETDNPIRGGFAVKRKQSRSMSRRYY